MTVVSASTSKKRRKIRPGVAPAETVRAQRHQSARNPRRDLVRNHFHVIRDRDEHALFVLEQRFQIGFSGAPVDAACSSA